MDPLSFFPNDIIEIDICSKKIEGCLDFSRFYKLKKLMCTYNKITSLNNLPNTLTYINCNCNYISSLNCPEPLISLYANHNKLTFLDNLPSNLKILDCSTNYITSQDNLPRTLSNER